VSVIHILHAPAVIHTTLFSSKRKWSLPLHARAKCCIAPLLRRLGTVADACPHVTLARAARYVQRDMSIGGDYYAVDVAWTLDNLTDAAVAGVTPTSGTVRFFAGQLTQVKNKREGGRAPRQLLHSTAHVRDGCDRSLHSHLPEHHVNRSLTLLTDPPPPPPPPSITSNTFTTINSPSTLTLRRTPHPMSR
jgi:hypothetical protein